MHNKRHNKCTAGHLGVSRTIKSVRLRFYWPGYKNEMLSWCKKCDVCAQRKAGRRRRHARLQQQPVGAPLERIALDILGGIPRTDRGNEYVHPCPWRLLYEMDRSLCFTKSNSANCCGLPG